MDWPTTRDAARQAGVKYFRTGAACKHGHAVERLVSTGACAECNRIRSREAQRKLWAADPDTMRAKAREAYQAKPDQYRATARKWRADNQPAALAYEKQWRADNLDKAREMDRAQRIKHADRNREYDRKWRDENRARYRSYHRRRQATKMQATPAWLTDKQLEAMVQVYVEAERLTAETGIRHEVDHIVPLQGKCPRNKESNVCGLHVPWNLQAIPERENRSKQHWFDDWGIAEFAPGV